MQDAGGFQLSIGAAKPVRKIGKVNSLIAMNCGWVFLIAKLDSQLENLSSRVAKLHSLEGRRVLAGTPTAKVASLNNECASLKDRGEVVRPNKLDTHCLQPQARRAESKFD
ncbi:hypothetical protein GCM10010918_41400 [Paenibacillus radicis (ex Gao et al. 2016)]|uniref:Uncharacterized protein n=1 Tax=Paenibacillus radicis (ex Gao et al. 2016) TaxID=1737354 RepID=A0A917M5X0_9BACL|nr:hypothetical protein GCM10010918_41400 [Paenibacillus radicis (ex Gao et al. 2016)]